MRRREQQLQGLRKKSEMSSCQTQTHALIVIPFLVMIQTDRQTDRQTDTQTHETHERTNTRTHTP